MANKKNLLLLFDRPNEPSFMLKGDASAVFDVPDSLLLKKHQGMVTSRAGAGESIPVQNLSTLPNLDIVMQLGRRENFSLFIPKHSRIAGELIDIFMTPKSTDELQSVALYAKDRVNPSLYNYALSVAILHRPDTKNLDLPLFAETFPDKFIDSRSMQEAREELSVRVGEERQKIIVPRQFTASTLEPEHCLNYFREDIGVNLHHWHWHLVYPFTAKDPEIVKKDRRGELFYYMHQQIIARYNYERFCNDLKQTVPLDNLREPIPEGYFSKLDSANAARYWPGRISGKVMQDINRETDEVHVKIADLERWKVNVKKAITDGYAVDVDGNRIPLDENRGIDILGNLMEPDIFSVNPDLYGSLHNTSHMLISYSHDPDQRHLESFGVMGASETAMRDPVFYRWHSVIDNLFKDFKNTLPPYTAQQLTFPQITVDGIRVETERQTPNVFHTFWKESDLNLSMGMDFGNREDVYAQFTHLQHQAFNIKIQVTNSSGAERRGMVRIFLAPKVDSDGRPWKFQDQRMFMIELDKFAVPLVPGRNNFIRSSRQSSVTIPYARIFKDENAPPVGMAEGVNNFCGCGWPNNML